MFSKCALASSFFLKASPREKHAAFDGCANAFMCPLRALYVWLQCFAFVVWSRAKHAATLPDCALVA